MQYAMTASHEALEDSGWKPETVEQQETTVRCSLTIEVQVGSHTAREYVSVRALVV